MTGTRLHDPARLAALQATALLDAEADEDLTRLTELATRLLGTPVSLVSLVAHDRQFFAAATGQAEPWASLRETPLSHSFCQYVVDGNAPLVVEDARVHPLVRESLAIRDLGVIAYAGVPVRGSDGAPLGALCAVDGKPRRWSDADLETLSSLAHIGSSLVELNGLRSGAGLRDVVTGLPARTLFGALVEDGLARAAAQGAKAAAIALDIDGFRLFNEALGYAAGDALLKQVADRIAGSLRRGDAVCRLGGDEFVVFCGEVEDEADALRITDRLVRQIAGEPVTVDGLPQAITVSAGAAVTEGVIEPHELAQAALARLAGARNASHAPLAATPAAAETRLALRNAVRRAHRRGEMALAYQPIVALDSGRIWGYEALLRWNHPELGFVPPDTFIPAAEDSGAIVDIGEWVLEQACRDAVTWRGLPDCEDLHVTVNVAPVQIGIPIFAQGIVASILDRVGLPAPALTLEITERTLLLDRPNHLETLQQLRELGVRIALDDFGTGYSALSYLTRFPLDKIKIDRSFVAQLRGLRPSASIVEGIVAMARALGLGTVAEGIEEPEQQDWLTRVGCNLGQGYHFSRPVGASVVEAHLRTHGTYV